MKDFDITIKIGISALDKSDAEHQLDYLLSELESSMQYDNYKIEIKEVGEFLVQCNTIIIKSKLRKSENFYRR